MPHDHPSCPCSFPDTISFTCALELAQLVRSGEIVNQKAHAGMHAACLLGSIAKQFDTDLVYSSGPDAPQFTSVEQAADYVIANAPQSAAPIEGGDAEQAQAGAIDPAIWQAVRYMLLMLIQQLLGS